MMNQFHKNISDEAKMGPHVMEIINGLSGVNGVTPFGMLGQRKDNDTPKGIMDKEGYDFELYKDGEAFRGQFKTGTYGNFNEYGKPRTSFVLGAPHNIELNSDSRPLRGICNYLITGYPNSNCTRMLAHVLINFRMLILACARKLKLHKEISSEKKPFAWLTVKELYEHDLIYRDKGKLVWDIEAFGLPNDEVEFKKFYKIK